MYYMICIGLLLKLISCMISHFEEKRSMSFGSVWFFIQIIIPILIKDENSQLSIATTCRKRPPAVSDHFKNNRFVSQSNTVSNITSKLALFQISCYSHSRYHKQFSTGRWNERGRAISLWCKGLGTTEETRQDGGYYTAPSERLSSGR